jgi:MoxR-like ATPase
MSGTPPSGPTIARPSSPDPDHGDRAPTGFGVGRTDSTRAQALFQALVDQVNTVLLAQDGNVRLAVGTFVARGHLLIEDLPGLGKTTLAIALARSFGLGFRRVQCTADLLPSDITGAMVFDQKSSAPVFRKGPIFTNVLMADELNRASARTQSALLESMEERQVTVDGHAEPLPSPFVVVATQNPHDAAGTSPLPHGQRDRFLVRLSMGYPDRMAEDALLAGRDPADWVKSLPAAVSANELAELMTAVEEVAVSPPARGYLLDLVAATRAHPSVTVGASPRAARALLRMSRSMAVGHGRSFVVPDDARSVAVPVLAHRLILDPRSQLTGADAEEVVREVLDTTPVPLVDSPG